MLEQMKKNLHWTRVEPVNKGFSADKKYHVWDKTGGEYLLRISPDSMFSQKQEQFALLKQLEERDIPVSRPMEFGRFDEDHVYLLFSWLEGVDAEDYIRNVDSDTAYKLGCQGGQILRTLQTVEIEPPKIPWGYGIRKRRPSAWKNSEIVPWTCPKRTCISPMYRRTWVLSKTDLRCSCTGTTTEAI